MLGRFPGKLDLIIIPRPDIPTFIKTDEVIFPNQVYKKLQGTNAKGLVSVQVLVALNIFLGRDTELSRKTTTEILHSMSMQALKRKNDGIFLDFEHITNLVTSIIALLKQQNKKLLKINEKIKEKVNTEISTNYQFIFTWIQWMKLRKI